MNCKEGYQLYKPQMLSGTRRIRHYIDYSSLPVSLVPSIIFPTSLNNYLGFANNREKKRISFLTSATSDFCATTTLPVLGMFKVVISNDPLCKQFDDIFLKANPLMAISILTGEVKIYDAITKDGASELPILDRLTNSLKEIGGDTANYIVLGLAIFIILNTMREK